MISRIEALRFRSLRDVGQDLGRFHVLLGPNGAGKSTFLDVPAFLSALLTHGLDDAVALWTENPLDLLWKGEGDSFELAIEAMLPEEIAKRTEPHSIIRYEIEVQVLPEVAIRHERVLFVAPRTPVKGQLDFFPRSSKPRATLLLPKTRGGQKSIVNKAAGGNDIFYSEAKSKGWSRAYKLGSRKSAFGNLPEDEIHYPGATWLKGLLANGVTKIALNGQKLRESSPPGASRTYSPDGSSLPWMIWRLEQDKKRISKLKDWIEHVRTAIPDIQSIRTVLRRDDRHRYLVLKYRGGLEIPSWMVSDGTLRLLALTLLAYQPDVRGSYLIEEPENGIHPHAVETVIQSLSSVYDAQIMLASHSPVVLGLVEPGDVLCFAKNRAGATDVVRGSEHPRLRDWKREANLGSLFAAGILG